MVEKKIGIDEFIYHQDNFQNVPDASVDLLLTDPPFNIARETNFHTYKNNTIHSYQFDREADNQWDTFTHEGFIEELSEWSSEFNRVLKKGGNFAIFCADAYISHFIDALKRNGLTPRRVISWMKPNAVPINRAYMPTSAVEYIIVGVKGNKAVFNADVSIVNEKVDSKIIEAVIVAEKVAAITGSAVRKAMLETSFPRGSEEHTEAVLSLVKETLLKEEKTIVGRVENMYKEKDGEKYLQACVPNHVSLPLKTGKRVHPTEKPVNLLQYLIALYSKEGDTVLDPFAGSGSTGEASLTLNRTPILVEREKEFYEQAKVRVERFTPNF